MNQRRNPAPAPSRSRTPLIVGAVIALVAVVAVVVVLVSGGDDDAETASTTVAPPVSDVGGTTPVGPTTTAGDAPTTTLPEFLQGEVRPVAVDGDPLPVFEGEDGDSGIGLTPPTLTGESFDGQPVVIGANDGEPTLVVFIAHWCPHCNAEIPRMMELYDDGRIPENLRVVGVSTGVAPDRPNFPPSEWIVDTGWPWEIMADGLDLDAGVFVGADAYGLSSFPYMVMIGADGSVVDRWAGESDVDELADRIAAGASA